MTFQINIYESTFKICQPLFHRKKVHISELPSKINFQQIWSKYVQISCMKTKWSWNDQIIQKHVFYRITDRDGATHARVSDRAKEVPF